jgi:hypothetical protein
METMPVPTFIRCVRAKRAEAIDALSIPHASPIQALSNPPASAWWTTSIHKSKGIPVGGIPKPIRMVVGLLVHLGVLILLVRHTIYAYRHGTEFQKMGAVASRMCRPASLPRKICYNGRPELTEHTICCDTRNGLSKKSLYMSQVSSKQ